MHDSSAPADRVRFGVFELDLRSGELRKAGSKVSLQEQPFRILAMLIDRPGRLVTREELRQELWPGDTFVDFEHGLNAAVKRLRDALGDSAETPRFVETIPRHGYRFLAPVQSDGGSLPSQMPAARPRPHIRNWLLASLSVSLVGGALGAGVLSRDTPATGAALVVLADVDNQTNDSVLNDTVRQAIAVKLSESDFINVISRQRVQETLTMIGRNPSEPLTPALARDVCQRVGGQATLSGAVAAVGASYVISLDAASCSTGEVLVRDQAQAGREEEILGALNAMTVRLRGRLGRWLRPTAPHQSASCPSQCTCS